MYSAITARSTRPPRAVVGNSNSSILRASSIGSPRWPALYDGCRTVANVRRSSYNRGAEVITTKVTEEILHPSRSDIELGAVLHALSDDVRLNIVAALATTEREATGGSFDVPVTKSTCTHHFKVLREAGVIHQRQEGTARLNALRREDLDARFPGLLETVLRSASAGAAR